MHACTINLIDLYIDFQRQELSRNPLSLKQLRTKTCKI